MPKLTSSIMAAALCLYPIITNAQYISPDLKNISKFEDLLNVHENDWRSMNDMMFAREIAEPMAFGSEANEYSSALVAWMYFARVMKSPQDKSSAQSMLWMDWHTNNETFKNPDSVTQVNTQHTTPHKGSHAHPNLAATDTGCPRNFPPQAVTRNQIGFDYLNKTAKIYSVDHLAEYMKAEGALQMPIGSVDVKGVFIDHKCIEQLDGMPGDNDYTLNYKQQAVWANVQVNQTEYNTIPMTGLHLMVKLAPTPDDPYTSEDASWFWMTFELDSNPGVENVRSMITRRDPFSKDKHLLNELKTMVAAGGDARLHNYSLSGIQYRFTFSNGGASVLGNSKLENFAGGGIVEFPQFKTPEKWTIFNSSCHACHATAAFNPETKKFFSESRIVKDKNGNKEIDFNEAFPLVVGNLPKSITDYLRGNKTDGTYAYKSLDFLWPVTFQFLNSNTSGHE